MSEKATVPSCADSASIRTGPSTKCAEAQARNATPKAPAQCSRRKNVSRLAGFLQYQACIVIKERPAKKIAHAAKFNPAAMSRDNPQTAATLPATPGTTHPGRRNSRQATSRPPSSMK